MYIKNVAQLLSKDLDKIQLKLRKIGLNALEKALQAVKPEVLVKKAIYIENYQLIIKDDVFNLKKFEKIFIIGGGKATAEMVSSLDEILKKANVTYFKGIINIPEGLDVVNLKINPKIKINYASHPIPNENGLIGTKSIMNLIEDSSKNDLIFCLISGGGSALLPLPKKDVSLDDLKHINELFLASGASIDEINAVRKHLSDFKGGNLAKKIYNSSGATLITLIISDVVGNRLDIIASGPTVPDSTTFKDAIHILKLYGLSDKGPSSINKLLEEGVIDEDLENPKFNHACFNNVHNYLIGSVDSASNELLICLKKQDFVVKHFSNRIEGEAKEFGRNLYQIIVQNIAKIIKKKERIALIGTGELTVKIIGKGVGGRNQEMLLGFIASLKDKSINCNFIAISINFDGKDGNSEAMGAIVDNYTLKQIAKEHINTKNYLKHNDSNNLFKNLNCEIITGLTGINVNDLVLILIELREN